MNRNDFFKAIANEFIQINGMPASSLSEAVVAVAHVSDDTEPQGVRCSVPASAVGAWRELSDDDRREIWELACAGRLDHAAEAATDNVRPIREHLTSEQIWNACFGPYETRASILAACESQGITPQDFATSAILEAQKQGFEGDRAEAFRSLCEQLDVAVG